MTLELDINHNVSSFSSSGSVMKPWLRLNPSTGALYLTENGYERLIQDNGMYKVLSQLCRIIKNP